MQVIDFFKNIELPDIRITSTRVKVRNTDYFLLKKNQNRYDLFFYNYNRTENEYSSRYSHLKKISFPLGFDKVEKVVSNDLKLIFKNVLDLILDLNKLEVKEIRLVETLTTKYVNRKILNISIEQYLQLLSDARKIFENANSVKNSIILHNSNKIKVNLFGEEVQKRTLTKKGEFNYLIDRFNLETKNNSKDFDKVLDRSDISSLEKLSDQLIKKEIFSQAFLRRLDDYFIKEKLRSIIDLGRKILDLGTTNLATDKAKEIIEEISPDQNIGQLETLWQRYFEKYLLYLIFSYKKIYSKIEIDTQHGNRYPDFLGVNHYGGVDIIEIKTHLKPALSYDTNHHNFSFSGELSKAIIQTVNYIDALVQDKNIKNSRGTVINDSIKDQVYSSNIHRPRGIIIISSELRLVNMRSRYDQELIERDFTKLRNSLNNIEILTFQEIIDMAENYMDNIHSR